MNALRYNNEYTIIFNFNLNKIMFNKNNFNNDIVYCIFDYNIIFIYIFNILNNIII